MLAALALVPAFVLEWWTPAGFAHGLVYAPLVLLAGMSHRFGVVALATASALVFHAVGAFVPVETVPDQPGWVLLGNRLGGSLAIFAAGAVATILLIQRASGLQASGRLETLADSMPQIVWITTPKGQAIYLNKAADAYTGRPRPGQSLSAHWLSALHPDDRQRCIDEWTRCLANGERYRTEFRLRRHDGVYRWHLTSGEPVRSEDGTILRWYGTTTDIEDIRRMEANLRQAQRLESLGQLTGGIAHDFNNLLTVILGNAEMLEDALQHDPGSDRELREQAAMVHRAARRGADLTQRLLAFSRRQSLVPEPVDIGQLLAESALLIGRSLGTHIHTTITPAPGLWPALVDAGQLESALINLALNARDAMPDGGWLTIEPSNQSVTPAQAAGEPGLQPGDYVVISVSDTGRGIHPDDLPRVMEPFYTTRSRDSGTGLGLSMVYGFIKQSSGHVRISSVQHAGTTVELYLPRAAADASPAQERPPEPASTAARDSRQLSVLMVEDDDLVRIHGQRLLQELGAHVHVAAVAADALQVLESGVWVDVLFTDVLMPGGMDGVALAGKARQLRPGLPVILTSGYVEQAGPDAFGNGHDILFLPKPYLRDSLGACLDRVTRARHAP